jgi:Metallo-beta-lactamase superfamily
MRQIAPGLYHWTAFHERIGAEVSSYYAPETGVLIDPLLPAGDDVLEFVSQHGPPRAILLTNRHHYRHSGRLAEALGIPIRASRPGMHNFSAEQRVEPFDFGSEPVPGVLAHEVGAICPDETALELPSVGALAVADGVVEASAGSLGFVPDFLLGDDPEDVKRAVRSSYGRLLSLDFEHLLLAHGAPVVDEGKQRLREFVEA